MKKMKSKYVMIVFLFSTNLMLAQNRWQFVNPSPTGFNLNNVNMDCKGNVWLLGDYGTILKSDNNCESWKTIKINYTENFYGSEIINNRIWIVGQNGLIIFSDDQGLTWIKKSSSTNKSLLKIHFIDENYGWIMANDSIILRTEDGGIDWEQIRLNNRWNQNDILFIDKDTGFLLTGDYGEPNLDIKAWTAGALYRTNDGGKTWSTIDNGSTKYSSIFFLNNRIGFMSIHNNKNGKVFLKSTNSGSTWDTISHTMDWEQIYFYDQQNGICIGDNYIGKTTDGGVNWELKSKINTPSTTSQFSSIYVNDKNILVVGTEGNILKSNNFGQTWENLTTSIDFYYASLRGVTFINQKTGYIYGDRYLENQGDKPILLFTDDGGKTWNDIPSPDSNDVSILKEFNGTLWASSGSKLFRSDNYGKSWTKVVDGTINNNDLIRDIFLFNNKQIIILSGRGVYQSTDGGSNWTKINEFGVQFLKQFVKINQNKWIVLGHSATIEPNFITYNAGKTWVELSNKFTTMQFLNENIGYAIDSSLYKTLNGGNTWDLVTESVKNISFWTSRLFFLNDTIGWLNSDNFLYYTNSGGNTWLKEYGIKDIVNHIGPTLSLIDKTEVWAVGSNGRVFRLSSDGVSGKEIINNKDSDNITLYQNFPNPFNPVTKIKFTIPHSEKVVLKIYDILGREILVLINDYLDTGIHEVIFDGNNLSSGVYFYKLITNNYSESKKLLLLK